MKKKALLRLCLVATLILSGCSKPDSDILDTTTTTETNNVQTQPAVDASDIFSDRDYSADYDVTSSVHINLNNTSISCTSDAVSISDGTLTISDEGTYILSGSLDDGMIIINAEKTDKLQLVLDGVNINSATSAPIYILQADKVFITLAENSSNILSNGGEFIAIDDNNIDAVIFSKEDLTLNGNGTLTVNSPVGHGIVSKDELTFTGGTINISTASHGATSKDNISVDGATLNIISGKDGLHADNDEDTTLGFLYIKNGNINVSAEDDGISASSYIQLDGGNFIIDSADDAIHSNSSLSVAGGNIVITESYEGLEGLSIEITGGDIQLTASDDGLNAAGGNDQSGFGGTHGNDMFAASSDSYIKISGGTLYINAEGDGIDSNGSLDVTGGTTIVSGPTNGGNGALDYGLSATISGGVFVASGASQMATNFTTASNQGVMMVNPGNISAEASVELTNSNGELLFSWTADKSFSSIIISTPEISQGETYTLSINSSAMEITMNELIYGFGDMGMPGGMGGPGGPGKPSGGRH